MGLFDVLFGRARDDEATIQEALRRVVFCRWYDAQYREYCAPEQAAKADTLRSDALKLLHRNGWKDARLAGFLESQAGRARFGRRDFEKYVGGWFRARKAMEDAYFEELKDLRLSTSQLHDVLRQEGWAEGEVNRFLLRFTPGGRAAQEAADAALDDDHDP